MYIKILPIFQFGDLKWVRRTDRRLAVWLELADLLGHLLESATPVSSPFAFRRFAVLVMARRLHFLFLHFGAQLWFAVCFRRFAVSHHVRLFSACLQRWGSVKNGAERRLRWFAVLVRRTPLALQRPWLNFGHFPPFCDPFALILHLLHFNDSCSIILLQSNILTLNWA